MPSSMEFLAMGFPELIFVSSTQLMPTIKLNGLRFFVSTHGKVKLFLVPVIALSLLLFPSLLTRQGYLYNLYGTPNIIGTYDYSQNTLRACIEEGILYILTEEGNFEMIWECVVAHVSLGIVTSPLRTTEGNSRHLSAESPMWIGAHPFSGLQNLIVTNSYVVLVCLMNLRSPHQAS
jgi:hypothetical protein